MRPLVWLALSLLATGPLGASDDIADSRKQALQYLLIQECGSCHGLTLQGGLGPALLPDKLTSRSPDYLTAIILDGRPGTAMPPWRSLLSPAEARWLADRLIEGHSK